MILLSKYELKLHDFKNKLVLYNLWNNKVWYIFLFSNYTFFIWSLLSTKGNLDNLVFGNNYNFDMESTLCIILFRA